MNEILLYFAIKYEGDFEKIYNAIMSKEKIDYSLFNKYKEEITCQYTTVISSNYPLKLKNLNRPPFVLFYEGNLDLINKKCIAVIGSRNNSEYGKEMCETIIKELVNYNYVIISGLARGIDIIAHENTINNNGLTIGVLGNGLDYYYPKENKDIQEIIKTKGLLISEYPPLCKPQKNNFPARNRIIAALCDGLLVIEAKRKSGTMITVNEALNLGKDIMCVPNKAMENSGCNYLIKNGAYLVENAKDIIEILNGSLIM